MSSEKPPRLEPAPVANLSSHFTSIVRNEHRVNAWLFNPSGTFLALADHSPRLLLFDTSDLTEWKLAKNLAHVSGQSAITDIDISPDSQFVASSSLDPRVSLHSTHPFVDSAPTHLDFADAGAPSLGIFSLKYADQGRSLVAGCTDNSVRLVDIPRGGATKLKAFFHDDVNAVAHDAQTDLVFAASDDCTIRAFDPRTPPAARMTFLGHTEGITSLHLCGSALLSNAKDQTCKLWDVRRASADGDVRNIDPRAYSQGRDYQSQTYDEASRKRLPADASLVTFYGHAVYKTLIRARFTPAGLVCSGSADGRVWMWNRDGSPAGDIDVGKSIHRKRTGDKKELAWHGPASAQHAPALTRDVAWHPRASMLVAASWAGSDLSKGAASAHHVLDNGDGEQGWVDLDGDELQGKAEHRPGEEGGPSGFTIVGRYPGGFYCKSGRFL